VVSLSAILSSCGWGETLGADQISDVSARLSGRIGNLAVTGDSTYWFEYGPTAAYGSSTPIRTVHFNNPDSETAVHANVLGLSEGGVTHYRLCSLDANGHGVCGADATLTTTTGQDSVTGTGYLFTSSFGSSGVQAGVHATSPSATATGTLWVLAGKYVLSGPITCLRVEGNRAVIGLVEERNESFDFDLDPPQPVLVYIEDREGTGTPDLLRISEQTAPVTTCPVPTESDFGPAKVIVAGDLIVHDHVGPAAP
jgi:hypothetical protein